jgi:fluoride ion exporter CrcB/FEX
MVVMIDGSGIELGSQVAPALFGYVIGIACAVSSFSFGRQIADSRSLDVNGTKYNSHVLVYRIFGVEYGSLFLALGLLLAAVVGDFLSGIIFYRELWISILLTPIGALTRWRLSRLNTKGISWRGLEWLPLGTFLCNIGGSIISVVATAARSNTSGHYSVSGEMWTNPILYGLASGLAGSLSTVSTFVKEIVTIQSPLRAHGYGYSTILISMITGIAIYSLIMRTSA